MQTGACAEQESRTGDLGPSENGESSGSTPVACGETSEQVEPAPAPAPAPTTATKKRRRSKKSAKRAAVGDESVVMADIPAMCYAFVIANLRACSQAAAVELLTKTYRAMCAEFKQLGRDFSHLA
eukprot:COSAG02_NODE_28286_length_592_cov_1.026369_1_plen_124_part_10